MTHDDDLYYDFHGNILEKQDLVRVAGISDSLFRITDFLGPGMVRMEQLLPVEQRAPRTISTHNLVRAINNSYAPPPGWEIPDEDDPNTPMLGSILPCGCFLRRSDCQAMLCDQHLIAVNSEGRS